MSLKLPITKKYTLPQTAELDLDGLFTIVGAQWLFLCAWLRMGFSSKSKNFWEIGHPQNYLQN